MVFEGWQYFLIPDHPKYWCDFHVCFATWAKPFMWVSCYVVLRTSHCAFFALMWPPLIFFFPHVTYNSKHDDNGLPLSTTTTIIIIIITTLPLWCLTLVSFMSFSFHSHEKEALWQALASSHIFLVYILISLHSLFSHGKQLLFNSNNGQVWSVIFFLFQSSRTAPQEWWRTCVCNIF